jgi:GDP-D-mannose dehydratase
MWGLITGIISQDRSRLTGMLPHTGLDAYGSLGRTSLLNTRRVEYICWRRHDLIPGIRLQYGNPTDGTAAPRRLPNLPSRPQHQSSPR